MITEPLVILQIVPQYVLYAAIVSAGAAIVASILGAGVSIWTQRSQRGFLEKANLQAAEQEKRIRGLDRFFEVRDAEIARARNEVSMLAHYAPLVASSITKVLFRLDEIVKSSGEISYFHDDRPSSEFVDYKRISTLYRVAILFAWLRAFKQEQALLSPLVVKKLLPEIDAVEKAFSDGQFVDMARVDLIVRDKSMDADGRDKASRMLSALLQDNLARHPDVPRHELFRLGAEEKADLCRQVVEVINQCLNIDFPLPPDNEQDKLLKRFGIREAWLYRDWQDAIGDMMLLETGKGTRRYSVIGYDQFEAFYHQVFGQSSFNPSVDNPMSLGASFQRWLPRLTRMFDQLDMSDSSDGRVTQMKNVFKAIKRLSVAIHSEIEEFEKRSIIAETHGKQQ